MGWGSLSDGHERDHWDKILGQREKKDFHSNTLKPFNTPNKGLTWEQIWESEKTQTNLHVIMIIIGVVAVLLLAERPKQVLTISNTVIVYYQEDIDTHEKRLCMANVTIIKIELSSGD